jgi:putative aminopeptidase FrvX
VKSILRKLSETYGPSGSESAVRELIMGEIQAAGILKRSGSGMKTDPMGNLIVRVPGRTGGKRVMLAAHMDEIGIVATHIDEKGFLRFAGIGGMRPLSFIGGRVRFANGITGVIGTERPEDPGKIPAIDKCYIDVGAQDKASCPVKIGDTACFERSYLESGNRIVGKAMDDRIGCAVILCALGRLADSPHDISYVFTVQEEVGSRGAMTSGYGVDPEIAVAVDVTLTGDTPECPPMAVRLGAGPAVKVKDSGMLSHPGVKGWLVRTAEKARIPFQLEVLEGGTTDARVIQTARAGVPTGCISIPCRYVHTPSETLDYRDALAAAELLTAALSGDLDIG